MHKFRTTIITLIFTFSGFNVLVYAGPNQHLNAVNNIVTDKSAYSAKKQDIPFNKPLDEQQAVSLALQNNLSLKALFERFGVDRADIIGESLLKNPTVSFSSRKSNEPDATRNTEWQVKVDAWDLLLWPLKHRSKTSQIKAGEYRLANEVLGFIKEVRLAYYELQQAQAIISTYQDDKKAQEAALEIAKRQYEAGNINLLEWQEAQALFHEATLAYLDSQRDAVIARENLNLLLGFAKGEDDLQISDQFKEVASVEPELSNLQQMAQENRLEITIAQAQIGLLSNKLAMSRGGILPSVEVGYDEEKETSGEKLKGMVYEAEVPIFNFNQTGLLRYESLLSEAKINVPAVEALVAKEVNVAYQQLITARAKVESFRNIMPVYQQMTKETLYHYNFMLKDVFQVLAAKREQLRAKAEYARSMREYWQARAELEHAVGHSLAYTPLMAKKDDGVPTKEEKVEHDHGG